MNKFRKPTYIPVNPGDLVDIKLMSGDPRGEKLSAATVVRVTRRYGRFNRGTTEHAPLITYRAQCSDRLGYCDNSFVLAVLRKQNRPIPAPKNVYREHGEDNGYVLTDKRGVWFGSLSALASRALSLLPFAIERQLNAHRLEVLFKRHGRPGLMESPVFQGLFHRVKAEKFQRWIRQNWSRILLTVEEAHQLNTETNDRFERDYYDNLDVDYAYFEDRYFDGDTQETIEVEEGSCYAPEDAY